MGSAKNWKRGFKSAASNLLVLCLRIATRLQPPHKCLSIRTGSSCARISVQSLSFVLSYLSLPIVRLCESFCKIMLACWEAGFALSPKLTLDYLTAENGFRLLGMVSKRNGRPRVGSLGVRVVVPKVFHQESVVVIDHPLLCRPVGLYLEGAISATEIARSTSPGSLGTAHTVRHSFFLARGGGCSTPRRRDTTLGVVVGTAKVVVAALGRGRIDMRPRRVDVIGQGGVGGWVEEIVQRLQPHLKAHVPVPNGETSASKRSTLENLNVPTTRTIIRLELPGQGSEYHEDRKQTTSRYLSTSDWQMAKQNLHSWLALFFVTQPKLE